MTEGIETAAAHEVGHLFGITEEEYLLSPCDFGIVPGNLCSGRATVGFWPSAGILISPAACFMGGQKAFALAQLSRYTWADDKHYNFLFSKFDSVGDPEVLLVTGILTKDGSMQLQPWHLSANFKTILKVEFLTVDRLRTPEDSWFCALKLRSPFSAVQLLYTFQNELIFP